MLIDQADRSLNPEKEGITDLLAVLNSVYKRGGTRAVFVPGKGGQWEVREMPTFAAVVIAGNSPNLPEDTLGFPLDRGGLLLGRGRLLGGQRRV